MILTLLLNWRTWAIGAYAALGLLVGVQTMRLSSCRANLVTEKAHVETLKANLESIGQQIREQNEAVAGWKASSDAAKKRAVVAMAGAETQALAHKSEVDTLRTKIASSASLQPLPNIPESQKDSCQSALSYLRSSMK